MSVYAVRESGESLRFLRSDIVVGVGGGSGGEESQKDDDRREDGGGRRVTRRVTGRVPESRPPAPAGVEAQVRL